MGKIQSLVPLNIVSDVKGAGVPGVPDAAPLADGQRPRPAAAEKRTGIWASCVRRMLCGIPPLLNCFFTAIKNARAMFLLA